MQHVDEDRRKRVVTDHKALLPRGLQVVGTLRLIVGLDQYLEGDPGIAATALQDIAV